MPDVDVDEARHAGRQQERTRRADDDRSRSRHCGFV
jgi:hypothetical protein